MVAQLNKKLVKLTAPRYVCLLHNDDDKILPSTE